MAARGPSQFRPDGSSDLPTIVQAALVSKAANGTKALPTHNRKMALERVYARRQSVLAFRNSIRFSKICVRTHDEKIFSGRVGL